MIATVETDKDVNPARTTSFGDVTVYSKIGCVQCVHTKRALDKRGIPYVEIDVISDPGAADRVRELGYSTLPVVVAGSAHWSGFDPDRIAGLVKVDRAAA